MTNESALPERRIVVLIPAHNEGPNIAATLAALNQQTRRPDRVVVIADNCTDDTVRIVRELGAEVVETSGNTEKKAGALNQAFVHRFRRSSAEDRRAPVPSWSIRLKNDRRKSRRRNAALEGHTSDTPLVPDLTDADYVLAMDADTQLSPRFLEVATRSLDSSPTIGAAGGIFYGHDGGGILGQLQRNEYARYGREIGRTGRVMVLTGTGTLFRVAALRQVARSRGLALPGPAGRVYDTLALTEDNELTLALKRLGWELTSPEECTVLTEIMPSWRDLWKQRMRWQRGALENLGNYGLEKTTLRYWFQQFGIGFGVIAFQAYLLLSVLIFLRSGFVYSTFWLAIGVIFFVERMITVWRIGWRGRLLALPIFIELGYDLFIQAVYVKSLYDIATRREARWHHITPSTPE